MNAVRSLGECWRWRAWGGEGGDGENRVSLLAGQVADSLELGGTEERRIKYCSQISGLSN